MMDIKKTLIYKIAKRTYFSGINFIRYVKRKPFIKPLTECILNSCIGRGEIHDFNQISIISSNCFAGRIMQDLKMEYNTPTLGLYFMYPDYIEFLSNLRHYLTEAKIEFLEHSKYPIGDERRAAWSHWYPIGLLNGKVEIHFLHYHSEKEAAEKWYRRAKRVNFDNLFIVGMQQNLCTEKDIIAFDALPFRHKVMFSTSQLTLESNIYMPEFAGSDSVGDAYKYGNVFYRHLIRHLSKD